MLVINGKEVFTRIEELVNPRYTALLLIDLQNDFIMSGGYFDRLGWELSTLRLIVQPIKHVLEVARHTGVLVVHVQMTTYRNSLSDSPAYLRQRLLLAGYKNDNSVEKLLGSCTDGTWGWQIVDEVAPLPNEVVVKKHRASAFIGTDLDMILRSNGIKSVVIVGVVTQGCVMATADDAPFFGYYPVLLRDCIASPSQERHDAALLIMSHAKDVVNCQEVLEVWHKSTS